ncbi:MAG TPA: GTPase Era [Acidimicrobiales bacterium]|nr:GTPase Era [Acidimicrobiales bacterium]
MRSGFATVAGRPNVGKSTLVNAMVGTKVSITSPRPGTTRFGVRGVLHRPDAQVVFVDTPGLHRPRTPLGERLNETAISSLEGVDVVVALVDATGGIGPGDRIVVQRSLAVTRGGAEHPAAALLVAVNKIDVATPAELLGRLASVAAAVEELAATAGDASLAEPVEYYPVSALTGEGVDALVAAIVERLPEGPPYYPPEMVSDMPEAIAVAELVREQLLARVREELPHSIACRVTEWEWPRIRCEIVVERDSQKGIVIGKGGEVLKAVGTAVRQQLAPGAYVELFVTVEPRWQRRADQLDELGY